MASVLKQFIQDLLSSEKGYQFDGYGGNPLDDDNKLTVFLIDYSFSENIEIMNLNNLSSLINRGTNFVSKLNSKILNLD